MVFLSEKYFSFRQIRQGVFMLLSHPMKNLKCIVADNEETFFSHTPRFVQQLFTYGQFTAPKQSNYCARNSWMSLMHINFDCSPLFTPTRNQKSINWALGTDQKLPRAINQRHEFSKLKWHFIGIYDLEPIISADSSEIVLYLLFLNQFWSNFWIFCPFFRHCTEQKGKNLKHLLLINHMNFSKL